MRLRRTLIFALMLFALAVPLGVHAQNTAYSVSGTDPDDVPVKIELLGLSSDRHGIDYRVTLLTHKPIRSIDMAVTAYTSEQYLGALSLRWPSTSGRTAARQGHTYTCTQHLFSKAIPADETLSISRGVLQVNFTDGTNWTSAGTVGASGR